MLAKRPPMGWNSWNTFGPYINEKVVMETADAMVERGLRDAGYEYVVIDDCWSLRQRGEDGRIVADPEKFPHGMKYVADYVHSKGLKFGMYSCAGTMTCAGYPGSFDNEYLDAKTFAEFGVDFLKYDNCYVPDHVHSPHLYRRMGLALKQSGREILFSLCNWGINDVHSWARSVGGHMYRSTGDICDNFESFKNIAISQLDKLGTSAVGCFNDPDMLICGMGGKGNVAAGGCTPEEYRMHFALWCMMGVPLMIGCDIRNCDEATLALLKDPALLAIDQDEEARPPVWLQPTVKDDIINLFKHLSDNRYVLGVFNFRDHDATNYTYLEDMGIPQTAGYTVKLRDLETGEEAAPLDRMIRTTIKSHTCKLFDVQIVEK